jgi:O-antigen ligase
MIKSLKNSIVQRLNSLLEQGQVAIQFWTLSAIILLSILLAIAMDDLKILALPAIALLIFLIIHDLRLIFLLLWASIPISTEFQLPGGFGTDMPSEPLAILLMGVGIIWFLKNIQTVKLTHLFHPITILLLLHFGWIIITSIESLNPFISIKYTLAKSWYLAAYFFLPIAFINSEKVLRKWFLFITIPLVFSIIWVILRHSGQSFTFASINSVLSPFYRNHVSYACTIAIFLPFIWYQFVTSKKRAGRLKWIGIIGFLLIATYLSYTRAAYLCVPLMIAYFFVIRLKLTKWLITAGIVAALVFIGFMANQNKYLDYAPNYDKTIAHYDFENLISATYKMEDISTMERFYRWIAGGYMLRKKPVTGFGPGNFYNFYHSYTDRSFITYVSDNPEKSGTHNYYLMVAVEQGLPGILIFILLICTMLIKGEALYHRSSIRKEQYFIMTCLLSLISILFILLLNDMIETDKVGAIFFFIAAMLVSIELKWIRFQPEDLDKRMLSDSSDN